MVALLDLLSPLAGLWLALNTYLIKYTSQIYLEAFPLLTSALAAWACLRARHQRNGWLLLSALFLGISSVASSKVE